jgi:hypothetical protein
MHKILVLLKLMLANLSIFRNRFDQKLLKSHLDKLIDWSIKWKLRINDDKCK